MIVSQKNSCFHGSASTAIEHSQGQASHQHDPKQAFAGRPMGASNLLLKARNRFVRIAESKAARTHRFRVSPCQTPFPTQVFAWKVVRPKRYERTAKNASRVVLADLIRRP
jgi:hypothetical protein